MWIIYHGFIVVGVHTLYLADAHKTLGTVLFSWHKDAQPTLGILWCLLIRARPKKNKKHQLAS